MTNPNYDFLQSAGIPNTTKSLAAVLFAATLGWSVPGESLRAQGVTPARSSAPSDAGTSVAVSSIVTAYAKGQDEKDQVTKEISVEEAKKEKLVARRNAEETKRAATDLAARHFNDSQPAQALRRDIANYKATCEGRMLYGAEIGRCNGALASINPRLSYNNSTMQGYFDQVRALQGQVQGTDGEIVLADAKITKLKNYLSWLTDANNKIATTLHQDCAGLESNPTIEELKLRCGNIQFDNARVDLPPCTTPRCQGWEIYTKPRRTPEQAIQDYRNSGAANPAPNPGLDRANVPSPTGSPK